LIKKSQVIDNKRQRFATFIFIDNLDTSNTLKNIIDHTHHDTQHNDIQHNDIQHNDIQHNNKQNATLSIMTISIMAEHCYAECHM
jgi:hypothetical protein